ncbi:MAG: ABC transporter permease [Phycisphaeraceae bacterium]|nr:ABC transporter permease [Phycisphaeraceae bacterium]
MSLRRHAFKELIKHAILWFVLVFAFFPFYLMIVISLKTNDQFVSNPWWFDSVSEWHWSNWTKAWGTVQTYIANSIVTSVGAVAFCLAMSVLTSYVLARYRFPGRTIIYYAIIASMFLPGTAATLVTTFVLYMDLGLVNSLWALVIAGAVGGQVMCIFILRQFIEEIPAELFDSAQVDGAGHLQQIRHIVLPMTGSIMGTLAILQFLGNWNNLIWPLVILRDDEKLTVPVGLMRLEGEYVKQWGELMAGYTISSIPLVLLFLFTMRLFTRSLTAGAIKG